MVATILKSIRSFKYAFLGIGWVVRSENNARIHLAATISGIIAAFYFNISKSEWLWIILCIALVWITEIINTGLEKLVDLVSPNFHPLAGKVKDLGAAAVLIAALFSIICAVVIFSSYF